MTAMLFFPMTWLGLLCVASAESTSPAADVKRPAAAASKKSAPGQEADAAQHFYIKEYRVEGGGSLLPQLKIEEAVYPYLGPYRTADDVEQARAALEQAYRDKGYQTVTVQVPQQETRGGVILLQVVKNTVGRLRVRDSRYFSLNQIKSETPSLAEGTVPDFSAVTRDIVALNQLPDRRVTPSLHTGQTPGTVDVDLNVKDTPPWHGSLEVNNRYSADTTPLRLNGSASYNNLWQMEHTAGFSFQVAPESIDEVKVFSGYYLARIPEWSWLSLMLQGTKQDSNVSTLGGADVAGRGEVIGARAIINLPAQKDFYHSVTLGFDYKHFDQALRFAGTNTVTPITYYPFSATYSATWAGKDYVTEFDSGVTFHARGIGSDEAEFDAKRFHAGGSFILFRSDLSHTRDLPEGFQIFGKAQGQAADQPLLDNEQFSGGGLGTVRGYLESEELGDNAVLGTVELRSPSLGNFIGKAVNEWRFYVFGDAGVLALNDPLPEQQARFDLASVGVGSRIKFEDHFSGSLDLGMPLLDGTQTQAGDLLLTFRAWAEF